MRKIFISAFAVIICLCSCNNEPKVASSMDDAAKRNLEVSHIHTDRGDMKGIDSLKAAVKWIQENMKDMKMELRREWADNEYVSSWMRFTGNNTTAMPGFPAGPYDWNTIELSRYEEGKLIEHWGFMDIQSVMKMMQPSGMSTVTDSSGRKVQ